MKLQKSYSKKITTMSNISVILILLISLIALSYYLINLEDKLFRDIAKKRLSLSNGYISAKTENKDLYKHMSAYNSGIIDKKSLKQAVKLANNNIFKIFSSISFDGESYYPPLSKPVSEIIKTNSGNSLKNTVVTNGDDFSILNVRSMGKVTLVSVYNITKDPILKKNISTTGAEGFQYKSGDRVYGWSKSYENYEEIKVSEYDDYHLNILPQYALVTSDIGIKDFNFIVSDEDMVERNNKIICLIFITFLSVVIAVLIVSEVIRQNLSKHLDSVVTDTRNLAIRGNGNSIKGKNYKYREFQSLINAFLTVLSTRDSVEYQLIKSKDKMEEIINLRTKELTKAVEKAEEANRGKMEFLAAVSHEIRTPMNCIIGFCELIMNEDMDQNAKSYSKRIINESETLLHLINDILDQSKIESGKMKLLVSSVDIESFIQKIVSLGNPYDTKGEVKCSYKLDPGIPKYIGVDEIRLYQVVSNIYFNALKYTSEGTVSIFVSYTEEESEKSIHISVHDTGIGIPAERVESVFDSYEQLGDGLTRSFRGTGLGLTITKKIVELLKGEIRVVSEVGVGSCFSVKIPVTLVDQDVRVIDKSRIHDESYISSGKILLVEDYPTNRIVAKKHLEAAGHKVCEVENGKEAVEICYREKFDLILMDIQMPIMDGLHATEKIRSEDGVNSNTPIVAMTANGLQSIKSQCYESGMNGIILKPIRRKTFLNSVKQSLTGDVVV